MNADEEHLKALSVALQHNALYWRPWYTLHRERRCTHARDVGCTDSGPDCDGHSGGRWELTETAERLGYDTQNERLWMLTVR